MIRRAVSVLLSIAVVLGFIVLAGVWLAGWRLDVVRTGSMVPSVPTNALAFVSPISPSDVAENDVISFNDPTDRRRVILHRVTKVVDNNGSGRFFRTQGDANATPDPLLVPGADVRGRLRWHVPKIGVLFRALRPPFSYVVLLVPAFCFVIWGELRSRRRGMPGSGCDVEPGYSLPVERCPLSAG
jgi:signal peptidase I